MRLFFGFSSEVQIPIHPVSNHYEIDSWTMTAVQRALDDYRLDNALTLAEILHQASPSDETCAVLADVHMRRQSFNSARDLLKASKTPRHRYLLAVCCLQLDLLREAENALRSGSGFADVPNGASGLHVLGVVCQRSNRPEQAAAYFSHALRMDPTHYDSFTALCDLGIPDADAVLGPLPSFPAAGPTSAMPPPHARAAPQASAKARAPATTPMATALQGASETPRSTQRGQAPTSAGLVGSAAPHSAALHSAAPHSAAPHSAPPSGPIFGSAPGSAMAPPVSAFASAWRSGGQPDYGTPVEAKGLRFDSAQSDASPGSFKQPFEDSATLSQASDTGERMPLDFHSRGDMSSSFGHRPPQALSFDTPSVDAANPVSGQRFHPASSAAHSMQPPASRPPPSAPMAPPSAMAPGSALEAQSPPPSAVGLTAGGRLLFASKDTSIADSPDCRDTSGMSRDSGEKPSKVCRLEPTGTASGTSDHASGHALGLGKLAVAVAEPKHVAAAAHQSGGGPLANDDTLGVAVAVLGVVGRAYHHLCLHRGGQALEMLHSLPPRHFESGLVQHLIGRAHFDMASYSRARDALETMRRVAPHRMAGLELLSTCLWQLNKKTELSYLA